ncbi:DUF5677 domain-containing protein [Flavobacterium sp. UBA7680]|uniref:DUF5677 domain-containing protein n=1 Tax=Flavobacterium sp. UBA7680 TaxID=1946559 RepID=UPI0025BE43B1|nr:DUF5677 domain-containing protein [Flavobacterium sp. UBA7680]
MGNYKKMQDLYQSINFESIEKINLEEKNQLDVLIHVAFTKSLQLNKILHEQIDNENSFLFLSSLRGICEEIIVLKYIHQEIKEADREAIVKSIFKVSTKKELEQQSIFMKKYRPAQPILNAELSDHIEAEGLEDIFKRNGINAKTLPPTFQLAQKVNLEELYNYLYRASCSFVHFNPRVMLRTVWYQNNNTEESNISITNFNKYYFSFCSFYSSYLLGLLYKTFNSKLNIDNESAQIVESIMEIIKNTTHFPELVTFEEFNLQRPETELTIINRHLKNQIF